jgi:dihydrofolate reductase
MEKIIIAALSNNRVIGNKEKIPWHIPQDLKRFRQLTLRHPVIMGRKTYESIGKTLDNRVNIIVTKNKDFSSRGIIICNSIEEALKKAEKYDDEVYIAGGSSIYHQTISLVDRMELTKVCRFVNGDSFFPEINMDRWNLINEKNFGSYSFLTYIKA